MGLVIETEAASPVSLGTNQGFVLLDRFGYTYKRPHRSDRTVSGYVTRMSPLVDLIADRTSPYFGIMGK